MDDVTRVKEAIDIVQYIGRYVSLKKSGRNFLGLCPFHGEKTPSFSVNPERGIFKCFGCGVSGDVISFVMQREGMSFVDALKMLADEAGVTISMVGKSDTEQKREERLYEILELSARFYAHILRKHPVAESAREYVLGRGLGEVSESEIVKIFRLGYAPSGWRNLADFLLKKGYGLNELFDSGMVVRSQKGERDRYFDMFRGRLMFPLVNKVGRVVGFSGRVLDGSKPKYINTAETALFRKREFLFGFYQAREAIRSEDSVIVVEGEMDMISSFRIGVKNAVAVKGSVLTEEHLQLIGKFTKRLLLCFDADKAGDMAQIRAIHDAIERGFEVKVIRLAQGKDADEVIRRDAQEWREAIRSAVPFYDFLIDVAVRRYGVSSAQGKSQISKEILPIIKQIGDLITRTHYVQKLAALLGVDEALVERMLRQGVGLTEIQPKTQEVRSELVKKKEEVTSEEWLMALMIRQLWVIRALESFLPKEALADNEARFVYTKGIEFVKTREEHSTEEFLAFVELEREGAREFLDALFLITVPEEDDVIRREIVTTAVFLKRRYLKNVLQKINRAIKQAQAQFGKENDVKELEKKLSLVVSELTRLEQPQSAFVLTNEQQERK
jgi:DNA primase